MKGKNYGVYFVYKSLFDNGKFILEPMKVQIIRLTNRILMNVYELISIRKYQKFRQQAE